MNIFQSVFLVAAAPLLLSAPVAAAADLDALVTQASKYESGASVEPLRDIERLLCDSIGVPEKRSEIEAALIRLLAPGTTFEAKRFACQHLAVHGSEATLPALSTLLKQEETVGIACLALSVQRSSQAGDLLRAALPAATGAARLQLVNTLGHRAEPASVKLLAGLAHDADDVIARAAVRALGAIDAPEARDAVAALLRAANPAVLPAAAEASLDVARTLATSGSAAAAAALCEALLKPTFPAHIRRGALGLLLRCDPDDGLQRIHALLGAAPVDPVLAAVATARIPDIRGADVSKAFGAVLPKLEREQQVLMIEALAVRADADALAVLRAQVGAAEPCVRCAAISAVGRLEDESSVPLLAAAFSRATSPEEVKGIQFALAGLQGGSKTDQAIIDALRQAAGKDKGPLMAVLARRGGDAAVHVLLEYASDADKDVSHAANQALTRIADGGDSAALAVLQKALSGGNPALCEPALRTLSAWRTVAAWDTLLGVYQKSERQEQHALALRGLVRIAGEGNAHPDAGLAERYRQLLAGARDVEDRKLILRVLSGAGHPVTLALALPLLEVPEVRPEAAEAVLKMANAIKDTQPEISRNALRRLEAGRPTPQRP